MFFAGMPHSRAVAVRLRFKASAGAVQWIYKQHKGKNMNLQEKIKSDLLDAARAKDSEKVSVLRMLQAAIKNKQIDLRGAEMTDEIILDVIAKQAKQRKESINEFEKGGRPELAEGEKKELAILESYLPEQVSDEEIEYAVKEIIGEIGASKGDFGKVMGAAAKKLKGKADGNRVRVIVERLL